MGQVLAQQGGARNAADNNNNGGRRRGGNSGVYFGENFTLAGQEFQSMTPESFLFGDMADLNFLSQISGTMPRVPPQVKHTNTLRALVNVHKNSIRLVRHANSDGPMDEYHLVFNFDADCDCTVKIHLFAEEVLSSSFLDFRPYSTGHVQLKDDTQHFKAGLTQTYGEPSHALKGLHQVSQGDLDYTINDGKLFFPLVIEVCADPSSLASSSTKHCQVTYCAFEKGDDENAPITVRVVAQKVHIDGTTYLLREIYGLEQKEDSNGNGDGDGDATAGGAAFSDADSDDETDHDCVVCMSSPMDTMVLPCRHLCLCNDCAEVLRFQSSKCPICRAAFHSVLRLQVAKRVEDLSEEQLEEHADGQEDTPAGYCAVPIVEALHSRPSTSGGGSGYLTVAAADGDDGDDGDGGGRGASRASSSSMSSRQLEESTGHGDGSVTTATTALTAATIDEISGGGGNGSEQVELLDMSRGDDGVHTRASTDSSSSSSSSSLTRTTINVQPSPSSSPSRQREHTEGPASAPLAPSSSSSSSSSSSAAPPRLPPLHHTPAHLPDLPMSHTHAPLPAVALDHGNDPDDDDDDDGDDGDDDGDGGVSTPGQRADRNRSNDVEMLEMHSAQQRQ